ncbi:MAG: hypothetical protein QOG73_3763, partial [Acetobacteraceae bacterium]|nr:hypothetical protein [Acetobacteraceae bacterium]
MRRQQRSPHPDTDIRPADAEHLDNAVNNSAAAVYVIDRAEQLDSHVSAANR